MRVVFVVTTDKTVAVFQKRETAIEWISRILADGKAHNVILAEKPVNP